ncbi:cupredoxin domain-containing protein [Aestuariivirga sp.]|uniref:cupredoxin domain-containing protein n=1 Tax=Aestuariivirga sp. TaxID=2650926 RepID=UPI003BAB9BAE
MKTLRHQTLAGLLLAALAGAAAGPASADEPTFRIELKDGVITPIELEVPANTRIRLELFNTGSSPVEFESVELKKEKVIAPGNSTVMVIRNLDPGTYAFFDDFHLDMPHAKITAK